MTVFILSAFSYFLVCQHFQFFTSTKATKLLEKNDVAKPDLFECESSSDSHEEPQVPSSQTLLNYMLLRVYIHGVSEKNSAKLSLSELPQISTNCNNFW